MKKYIILMFLIFFINVKASSYIVMDSDNSRVLEGNNIYNKSLIASTSKIMTSLVVINNTNLDKVIEIDESVLSSFGSAIYLSVGERISIRDLLYGLMLRSGNDAAISLANYTAGSMNNFAYLMNKTAKVIGMQNTNFINSSGLEDGDNGNISTVYDMALLSSYAINSFTYRQIVGTKTYVAKTNLKTYHWTNKNKLLFNYDYCIGGKTGYTVKAKRTLVTNAQKDNVNLTIVSFKDPNDFDNHKLMYDKYFKLLTNYHIVEKGLIKTKFNDTYVDKDFYMSLTDEEYNNISKKIVYFDNNGSNIIGKLIISLNDKVYFETNIYQKAYLKKEHKLLAFFHRLFNW